MNTDDGRLTRLHAAYLTGCVGKNIFQSYLPFLLRALSEKKVAVADIAVARAAVRDRYGLDLPHTFLHSILKAGHASGDLGYDPKRGKYTVSANARKDIGADDEQFRAKWQKLVNAFSRFCEKKAVAAFTEDQILECIDRCDALDLADVDIDGVPRKDDATLDFLWRSFVVDIYSTDSNLFDFVAALSLASVVRDARFFDGDARKNFSGLRVYLDTPIVFGVLGLDEQPRVELCRHLVGQLKVAGCSLHIFDHCFLELERNMVDANRWAHSADYDASKATPVARAMFDSHDSEEAIALRIERLKDELLEDGIHEVKTEYAASENSFQEDEKTLQELLTARYTRAGREMSVPKEKSILVDIRSMVVVWRCRHGYMPTHLYDSRHILVTLNSAVAGAAHDYLLANRKREDTIPPCVTADVLGSALWLFSPVDLANYRKLRLLADCYSQTNPSRELLDKYSRQLHQLHDAGRITEEQFIKCRASSLVRRPLAACVFGNADEVSEKTCYEVIEALEEHDRFERDKAVNAERDAWKKKMVEEKERFRMEQQRSNEALRGKEDELRDARLRTVEEQNKATELDKLVSSTVRQKDKLVRLVSAVIAWLVLGVLLCSVTASVTLIPCVSEVLTELGVPPFWTGGVVALLGELLVGWKTPIIRWFSGCVARSLNQWMAR